MKTKVKVSKKAVGVFVVSLTILLLLVFVTAPASKANTSTQCVLTPVQSIATGMDTPTDTPMEPVPFPNVTGMPWDVFTPTTGGGASPPIVAPVTPAVVSGGGMPWDIFTGQTHNPHLPVSSPIPQGQYSPFVTPQHGGPVHLPSPVACGIMGEESALSANITIPVPETDDMEEEDEDEWGRSAQILKVWATVRRTGVTVGSELISMRGDDWTQKYNLSKEIDAEISRVGRIMQATNGMVARGQYENVFNYLNDFRWMIGDTVQRIRLEVGADDRIQFESGASNSRLRNPDPDERERRRQEGIERAWNRQNG